MLMAFPFLANRPSIASMNFKGLRGFCKPKTPIHGTARRVTVKFMSGFGKQRKWTDTRP